MLMVLLLALLRLTVILQLPDQLILKVMSDWVDRVSSPHHIMDLQAQSALQLRTGPSVPMVPDTI